MSVPHVAVILNRGAQALEQYGSEAPWAATQAARETIAAKRETWNFITGMVGVAGILSFFFGGLLQLKYHDHDLEALLGAQSISHLAGGAADLIYPS